MYANHAEVANFEFGKYVFNAIRENRILANISAFTVIDSQEYFQSSSYCISILLHCTQMHSDQRLFIYCLENSIYQPIMTKADDTFCDILKHEV